MSTRVDVIKLADTITRANAGNTIAAYTNACSERNVDSWWMLAAQSAGVIDISHSMREHVIALLHLRMRTPDPFEGFPK